MANCNTQRHTRTHTHTASLHNNARCVIQKKTSDKTLSHGIHHPAALNDSPHPGDGKKLHIHARTHTRTHVLTEPHIHTDAHIFTNSHTHVHGTYKHRTILNQTARDKEQTGTLSEKDKPFQRQSQPRPLHCCLHLTPQASQ